VKARFSLFPVTVCRSSVTYEVVSVAGLGHAGVDDEVDDDGLSLGPFPCVDANDVADGEVADANLVGHGQVRHGIVLGGRLLSHGGL